MERSYEMMKIEADMGYGGYMISHEEYRQWAKTHGDVFKLEVVVTLHSKAEGDDWTR